MILYFFIILILIINCNKYSFNGGKIDFNKLLDNIITLNSIGCTKNHITDNTYYHILKTKNENDLHNICKDAYDSKLKYEDDINQQLCCEKDTVCLPKCKKLLDSINKTNLDNELEFLNEPGNINKEKFSGLENLKRLLSILNTTIHSERSSLYTKINNYIDIYNQINELYIKAGNDYKAYSNDNSNLTKEIILKIYNLKPYVNDVLIFLRNIKETLEQDSQKILLNISYNNSPISTSAAVSTSAPISTNMQNIFENGYSDDILPKNKISEYFDKTKTLYTDLDNNKYKSYYQFNREKERLISEIDRLKELSNRYASTNKQEIINKYNTIKRDITYLLENNWLYFYNFKRELDKTLSNFLKDNQTIKIKNFKNFQKLLDLTDNIIKTNKDDIEKNRSYYKIIVNKYHKSYIRIENCYNKTTLIMPKNTFTPAPSKKLLFYISILTLFFNNLNNTLTETSTRKLKDILFDMDGGITVGDDSCDQINITNYVSKLTIFKNNSFVIANEPTFTSLNNGSDYIIKTTYKSINEEIDKINISLNELRNSTFDLRQTVDKYNLIRFRTKYLLNTKQNCFDKFTDALSNDLPKFLKQSNEYSKLKDFKDFNFLFDIITSKISSDKTNYNLTEFETVRSGLQNELVNRFNNIKKLKNKLNNLLTKATVDGSNSFKHFYNKSSYDVKFNSEYLKTGYKNNYNIVNSEKTRVETYFNKMKKYIKVILELKINASQKRFNKLVSTCEYKNAKDFINNFNIFRHYIDHYQDNLVIEQLENKINSFPITVTEGDYTLNINHSNYNKKTNLTSTKLKDIIDNLIKDFYNSSTTNIKSLNNEHWNFSGTYTTLNYKYNNLTTAYELPNNTYERQFKSYINYKSSIKYMIIWRWSLFPTFDTTHNTFVTYMNTVFDDYNGLHDHQITTIGKKYTSGRETSTATLEQRNSNTDINGFHPRMGKGLFDPDYYDREKNLNTFLGRQQSFSVYDYRQYIRNFNVHTEGPSHSNKSTFDYSRDHTEYYLRDLMNEGPPNSYLVWVPWHDRKYLPKEDRGESLGANEVQTYTRNVTNSVVNGTLIHVPTLKDMFIKFSKLIPFTDRAGSWPNKWFNGNTLINPNRYLYMNNHDPDKGKVENRVATNNWSGNVIPTYNKANETFKSKYIDGKTSFTKFKNIMTLIGSICNDGGDLNSEQTGHLTYMIFTNRYVDGSLDSNVEKQGDANRRWNKLSSDKGQNLRWNTPKDIIYPMRRSCNDDYNNSWAGTLWWHECTVGWNNTISFYADNKSIYDGWDGNNAGWRSDNQYGLKPTDKNGNHPWNDKNFNTGVTGVFLKNNCSYQFGCHPEAAYGDCGEAISYDLQNYDTNGNKKSDIRTAGQLFTRTTALHGSKTRDSTYRCMELHNLGKSSNYPNGNTWRYPSRYNNPFLTVTHGDYMNDRVSNYRVFNVKLYDMLSHNWGVGYGAISGGIYNKVPLNDLSSGRLVTIKIETVIKVMLVVHTFYSELENYFRNFYTGNSVLDSSFTVSFSQDTDLTNSDLTSINSSSVSFPT